jgi:hypothetical protein
MLHAFFKQLAAGGNILAGRTLWLRAESLGLSNGQSVASWTNEGSAGGTFANVAGLPTYNTNQVNGKPAVTFQGGQALPTTRTVADILGLGQTWSYVVAARAIGDQSATPSGPPLLGSAADTFGIFVVDHRVIPQVGTTSYVGASYTSSAPFVFGCANAASGSHHVFNSTASANANLPSLSAAGSQILRIGVNTQSENFAFMGILEMMAFNKFKTAAELAAIAATLRGKYAIS